MSLVNFGRWIDSFVGKTVTVTVLPTNESIQRPNLQ